MVRQFLIFGLVLQILGLGCDVRRNHMSDQDHPLAAVRVVAAQRQKIQSRHQLIGRTEPHLAADLRFEVEGLIKEVFVEVGDRVKQGTPIASLFDEDYQLAMQAAKAQLASATSQLSLLYEGTRKEDIQIAKEEYDSIAATTRYHFRELQRVESLLKSSNAATEADRDLQQMLYSSNAKKLEAAKARLQRAEAGPRKQEIADAESQVQLQTQRLELAKRALNKTTLLAPFDGTIQKRITDPGSLTHTAPNGPVSVVQIADNKKLDAVFAVPERIVHAFQKSETVRLSAAVDKNIQTEGFVLSIGEMADSNTGTYELCVRIENPNDIFLANSVVVLDHEKTINQSALIVPLTAIRRSYNSPPYVLVVGENDRIEAREVQIRPIAPDCEIIVGLNAGERVVVGGGHRVIPGEQVVAIPPDAAIADHQSSSPTKSTTAATDRLDKDAR